MKHEFHTVTDILKTKMETPLDLAIIPDHMGINLCSVEAVSWTEQDDGQLVSLTVHFNPARDAAGDRSTNAAQATADE